MATFVFNIAKGRLGQYASLPAANDALIAIPIVAAGVEADAVIMDYATVAAILAATTDEQLTMGRRTLTGVTVTVDNVNDRVNIDCADIVWLAATGAAISDILICYDPDTTTSTDATRIPLTWHDYVAIPDGTDITATVADFARPS